MLRDVLSAWTRGALTCERAVQLGAEAMDREIGRAEGFRLAVHKLGCRPCRRAIRRKAFEEGLRKAMQPRPDGRQAAAGRGPRDRRTSGVDPRGVS